MVIADTPAAALLQEGRWPEARAAFESALSERVTGDALSGLATALLWTSEIQSSIQHHQRAYNAYREEGNGVAAAFEALTISITYNCYLGNESAAHGWVSRAESTVSPDELHLVEGHLWSFKGYMATDYDLALSEDFQRRALERARETGDRDLELIAMGSLGAVLTRAGRIREGLSLVDEAMAALSAGEHGRIDTVVIVCCTMLMACEAGADLRRAREWCKIADQFHQRYGCPFMYGECRAMYGRLLMTLGQWTRAERELRTAIDVTRDHYPPVFLGATATLAELRLRQGRLEEAEALVRGLEHEVRTAAVAAGINLARNHPAVAIQLLQRALRRLDPRSVASIQAMERLVEAYAVAGEMPAAEKALDGLLESSADATWPESTARAAAAAGRLLLASGDIAAATTQLEDAIAAFARLGMPYETASTRMMLARAYSVTQPDLALAEAGSALDTFEQLGARPGADAAAALLRELGQHSKPGPRSHGLLTLREQEVLALLRSGLSNPEIAERLVISRKTAAHHVSSLLAKLGVRNRAEAVAIAARLSPDPQVSVA